MAKLNRIRGDVGTIREMLLAAGIGEYNAVLSIPYMYFLPRTCDPYAQGVQQIVQGLQNLLAYRGLQVPQDGFMGSSTMAATERFAGRMWRDKTWLQLYGDVIRGRLAPGFEKTPQPAPVEAPQPQAVGFVDVIDLATNPLAWVAGGAAFYFLVHKKKPNPARARAR